MSNIVQKFINGKCNKEELNEKWRDNENQYIRLLPPLNIEKKDIDFFLEEFTTILNNYNE